jgi:hypothetical protein
VSNKEEETIKKFKKELSLENIPENLRTEKVCVLALSEDFAANIEYVPTEIKTEQFLRKRIQSERSALGIVSTPSFMPGNTGLLLQYIPEEFKTITVCTTAIKNNPSNIEYTPTEMLKPEFIKDMVMVNGAVLEYVPEEMKTEKLCRQAFENNVSALSYFPESMIVEADCERYIAEGHSIVAIPQKYLTPSLLAFGVRSKEHRKDRWFFNNSIPRKFKTPELMLELIKLDANYLYRFWDHFKNLGMIDEKSLLKILTINGQCLHWVPKDLLTDEMCLTALNSLYKDYLNTGFRIRNIELLKFFPKSLIDDGIAAKAVAMNEKNLKYIPARLKTEALIQAATHTVPFHEIIEYLPKSMITEEVCLDVINKDVKGFRYIPDKMKTERVCQAALNASSYFEDIIDQIPKDLHLPEIVIHCKKSRYPNVKKFTQLMDEWVENKAASNDDFALLLANAPESLKKSDAWKKWALIYL